MKGEKYEMPKLEELNLSQFQLVRGDDVETGNSNGEPGAEEPLD